MMIAAGSNLLPDVTSPATQHLLDILDDSSDAASVALEHLLDSQDSIDAVSVALDTTPISGCFIESYSEQSSANAPSYSHPQCDRKTDFMYIYLYILNTLYNLSVNLNSTFYCF